MKKAFLPWLRGNPEPQVNGQVLIRGKKVVIRDKHLMDAAEDYVWRTDEELSRLDATSPLGMSYEEFMSYSQEEVLYANPSSKRLAIDTIDGHHIGNCMYYDINPRRGVAELGIMIGDRRYWDRGYGSDSVNALLRHIFDTTSLNRVYLHTLEWNFRAQRCFAKSGFREVKKLQRNGMDFVLMEISRPEWEGRSEGSEEGDPLT